jgi:hypothetical protein
MSTKTIDKLKDIFFFGEPKEKIITEDGKRNLYFDRQRNNYIKFTLDVGTTCSTIYKLHKQAISQKLKEIYGQNVDEEQFSFLIVELLSNKYDQKATLIELKIGMDDKILFSTLQNNRLMLCYLRYNNQKHISLLKQNIKNLTTFNSLANNLYTNTEENICMKKDENDYEIFLSKTIIHYYNEETQSFSKEKIRISEKDITIYAKKDRCVLIKEIQQMNILTNSKYADVSKFFAKYRVKGEKPKFCIELITLKNEKLLIGRNTFEPFVTLTKAIQSAAINYQNISSCATLNNKIIEGTNSLFATNNIISQSCFTINDFITNKERRKILFKDFEEKQLANIVNNIMEFKANIKKKKYNDAINNIKILREIIKEKMTKEELDKYEKIINKEKIEYIEDINNKIDTICPEGDGNIDGDEKKINELKKILNINMFDYIYLEIRDEYISKYYEDNFLNNKNNSTVNIKEKVKLLLGKYFTNTFDFKKEEDFCYLGDDKVEKMIKDCNDEILKNRKNRFYVLSQK